MCYVRHVAKVDCGRRLKCCRYLQMTRLGGIKCLLDGDRGLIEMNEYLRSTGVFLDCDYSDLVSFWRPWTQRGESPSDELWQTQNQVPSKDFYRRQNSLFRQRQWYRPRLVRNERWQFVYLCPISEWRISLRKGERAKNVWVGEIHLDNYLIPRTPIC